MEAQTHSTHPCCEKSSNYQAVLVFMNENSIGITNVCRKCGYLFLDQTMLALDASKPNPQLVNFLQDTKNQIFIIQKLLSKITYLYSTDPNISLEEWSKTLKKEILNLSPSHDSQTNTDRPEIYL